VEAVVEAVVVELKDEILDEDGDFGAGILNFIELGINIGAEGAAEGRTEDLTWEGTVDVSAVMLEPVVDTVEGVSVVGGSAASCAVASNANPSTSTLKLNL
jgi:hypothetical protein